MGTVGDLPVGHVEQQAHAGQMQLANTQFSSLPSPWDTVSLVRKSCAPPKVLRSPKQACVCRLRNLLACV